MAFRIKYARLFVCRILHGFYLHQGDRSNYFDLDSVTDAGLIRSLDTNYALERSLQVFPLPQTAIDLRNYKMRMATTPMGFIVGMAVDIVLDGGVEYFEPKILPDPGQTWSFGLRLTDPTWGVITAERMRPNVPAQYYFTNLEELPQDAGVALSQQAAARESRTYVAGERVYDAGAAQLYRAIRTDDANNPLTDTAFWEPITDRHEVNDADRVLLPQRFLYRFTPLAGITITDAQVDLNATDGTTIDTQTFTNPDGLTAVALDYREDDLRGWFDLVVSGTGGYATTKRILIDPDRYDPANWGVIAIGHEPGLDYANRLLMADDRLRHDTGLIDTPVFEVRIPNQFTYWRYKAHPSQTLNPVAASSDVDLAGDYLETTEHKPLTRYGSQINYRHTPTNEDMFLPNPSTQRVLADGDGKLYSDVYLGILDL